MGIASWEVTPRPGEERPPGARKEGRTSVARPLGTLARIRAVSGIWLLNGRMVRLHEDPRTGVLLASYSSGERENPLKVLTRGTRAELPEGSPHWAPFQGGDE
jgi:hypothetical protein